MGQYYKVAMSMHCPKSVPRIDSNYLTLILMYLLSLCYHIDWNTEAIYYTLVDAKAYVSTIRVLACLPKLISHVCNLSVSKLCHLKEGFLQTKINKIMTINLIYVFQENERLKNIGLCNYRTKQP